MCIQRYLVNRLGHRHGLQYDNGFISECICRSANAQYARTDALPVFVCGIFIVKYSLHWTLLPIGQLDGGTCHTVCLVPKGTCWLPAVYSLHLCFIQAWRDFPGMNGPDLLLYMPLYASFLYFYIQRFRIQHAEYHHCEPSGFLVQFLLVIYFPGVRGFNGFYCLHFCWDVLERIQHPGAEVKLLSCQKDFRLDCACYFNIVLYHQALYRQSYYSRTSNRLAWTFRFVANVLGTVLTR